ncbi:LPS O-antigen length regulator [Pseudoalteromonas sp. KS88]|nr:LPS O-antigen length regulator [Pseudoalteromonas sp. KS88]
MKVGESDSSDGLTATDLVLAIWKHKLLIIATTTMFVIFSVLYAVNQPNIYKSEAVLAPVEQVNSSSLNSQFGGLANLAGINLGHSGANKTQLALETLQSRKFIQSFILRHDILPELFAADVWYMHNNTLGYDEELYDNNKKVWVRTVAPPKKAKPSLQEAYKQFSRIINISEDSETGFIKLHIMHLSPYIAQEWVTLLVKDINSYMKNQEVKEAIKSQKFLLEQLKQTKVADMRVVLFNLYEEQAKTVMFANVREEYVFKTLDPAIVPELKDSPRRALICILGALAGICIGLLIVFTRLFYAHSKS